MKYLALYKNWVFWIIVIIYTAIAMIGEPRHIAVIFGTFVAAFFITAVFASIFWLIYFYIPKKLKKR